MIFLTYCAYGFGIPIIIASLIAIVHEFELIPENYMHKMEVNKTCSFGGSRDDERTFGIVYTGIPLAIMLSINIIFYTTTAFTIFKIQRQTAFVKNNTRYEQNKKRYIKCRLKVLLIIRMAKFGHDSTLKNIFIFIILKFKLFYFRFLLYFRLFIIMGITWISEAVSFFTKPHLITSFISIINCLQGVLIFIHFIWRSRVEKYIRKKWVNSSFEK